MKLTPAAGENFLAVWDHKSGNLAVEPISKLKGTWKVATSDFQEIASVEVIAVHNDLPLAKGQVELSDGSARATATLSDSSKGLVTFFGVKPGKIASTVRYSTDKGVAGTVTQLFTPSLTRTDPTPRFTVAVAEAVATLGASTPATTASTTAPNAATPAAPTQPQPAPDRGSALGGFLMMLVAIGFMVVLVYFLLQYNSKNPDLVASKLQQLGVQIPQPGDHALNSPIPAQIDPPRAPQPPQKIMLGDGPLDPIPSPMPIASPLMAPVVAVAEPSLIAESGVAIPLQDGENVVGREAGLALSLMGETTVSRRHATVVKAGSQVTVTDLGSTNGTFVNGGKVESPVVLRIGDSVQFGSVRFTYRA